MQARQRLTPTAFAVATLASATLLIAAQRTYAAEAEPNTLLPTQDPCGTCDRPLAQAPATATVAPQSLPAPPRPAGATFKLNDLRLNGVKALSNEELQSITAPYIGRDVTLTDLEELAKAITARYKERGYFLAQAVVPVQTVRDGVVEISVIEAGSARSTSSSRPTHRSARRACAAFSRRCNPARP
ncbi:POTRA domain-containing protein [Variovorax sp. E3]|uniref:POTRA domain-containing protein n=1 Tax=Variovorax sp. E3 TaxID=1914993 RepID=UPI0022B6E8AC|nr:POTRA domain-containing protein [Variovorax sp. E3]